MLCVYYTNYLIWTKIEFIFYSSFILFTTPSLVRFSYIFSHHLSSAFFHQQSFTVLQEWIAELHRLGPPNIVLVIAGNKCDLDDKREVRVKPLIVYLMVALVYKMGCSVSMRKENMFTAI